MTELKPCPFCGCKVKIVIGIYGLHDAPDYYTIVHPENGCIMDEFACYSTDDKEELIEDWNKREPCTFCGEKIIYDESE